MSDVIRDGTPSDPTFGEETITYRSNLAMRVMVVGVCAVAMFSGAAVGADPVAPVAQRGLGWAVAALSLGLAVRAVRAGLVADRTNLVDRGWLTTRRLTWDQVGSIKVWYRGRGYGMRITRVDGRRGWLTSMAEFGTARLVERAEALRHLGGLPPSTSPVPVIADPGWGTAVVFIAGIAAITIVVAVLDEEPAPRVDRTGLDDLFGPATVGHCVPGVPTELPLDRAVDCAPGTTRLLAIIELDASMPYPGHVALEREADALCPLESDRWLLPTEQSWGPDGDGIYCLRKL